MSGISSVVGWVSGKAAGLVARTAKTAAVTAVCAIGQKAIYSIGDFTGRKIYSITGGRVSLPRIVPECLKMPCRMVGEFINDKIIYPIAYGMPNISTLTRRIPLSSYFPLSTTLVACPVIEEAIFRLPIVLIAGDVSDCACTSESLLKGVATVVASTAFTFYHERTSLVNALNPGRAAGIFLSGIGYALIASNLGIEQAILAHSAYNVSAYL